LILTRIKTLTRNSLDYTILRIKWLLSKSNYESSSNIHAHLLVVKKPIYAKVVRTCIESFLYHHPDSQVSIYCDKATISSLRRRLFLVRLLKANVFTLKLIDSDDTWQTSKLFLLTQLNSPNDIFLDADLKFNGRLPLLRTITFFVKEENFLVQPQRTNILESKTLASTNRNTSIFSWSGKVPDAAQFQILDEIYSSLEDILLPDAKREEYLGRLREQISISIFVDILKMDVGYIKFEDSQFDGKIVESSYFGATGSLFGALGNRTLRSKIGAYFLGSSKNS